MSRRTTRLRREYLYRKSLEGAQREEYEKKRAIREALQEGKPVPTELRKEANQLKKQVDLEDDNTAVQRTHIDDEYGDLGVSDPQVCLVTHKAPSASSFCTLLSSHLLLRTLPRVFWTLLVSQKSLKRAVPKQMHCCACVQTVHSVCALRLDCRCSSLPVETPAAA